MPLVPRWAHPPLCRRRHTPFCRSGHSVYWISADVAREPVAGVQGPAAAGSTFIVLGPVALLPWWQRRVLSGAPPRHRSGVLGGGRLSRRPGAGGTGQFPARRVGDLAVIPAGYAPALCLILPR